MILHAKCSPFHVVAQAALCLVLGCTKSDHHRSPAADSSTTAAAIPESAPTVTSSQSVSVHDPLHPPIDCPLRKQGVNPDHMRPFADVEQYIAFLERPDRLAWQKPDEVVAALGLKGHEQIFDLGAGSGYFAFRFAKAIPNGKVIAGDTEAEMIRHIHHRAMSEGIKNVEVKLIQPGDPTLPEGVDLVFVCDVLHHVPDRPVWLSKLASQLKSGARVAIIEFKEGRLPEGPPESLKIPRAELLRQLTTAGFVPDEERAELLPYQLFLVFRKP